MSCREHNAPCLFLQGGIFFRQGQMNADDGLSVASEGRDDLAGLDVQGLVGRANRNGIVAIGFEFRRIVYKNVLADCWVSVDGPSSVLLFFHSGPWAGWAAIE